MMHEKKYRALLNIQGILLTVLFIALVIVAARPECHTSSTVLKAEPMVEYTEHPL